MSIRLVNESGEVFWFTSINWGRLIAFAARYGWPPNSSLDPDNWNESLTFNDKYEMVGGASLTGVESKALANAIARGICDDPENTGVAEELAVHAEQVRRKLPSYDPARHARDLLQEWSRFQAFALRGGFRVDLTD